MMFKAPFPSVSPSPTDFKICLHHILVSPGEVETEYAAVLNSDAISTWPPSSPSRWNILLDAVLVGSNTVSVSSTVAGVPSGKAVRLNINQSLLIYPHLIFFPGCAPRHWYIIRVRLLVAPLACAH